MLGYEGRSWRNRDSSAHFFSSPLEMACSSSEVERTVLYQACSALLFSVFLDAFEGKSIPAASLNDFAGIITIMTSIGIAENTLSLVHTRRQIC